jgi:putative membrane protein
LPALDAPSQEDVAWIQAAHQRNLAEIAAGDAAQQQGTTQEVKDLGARLVQTHTELDTALTRAAHELGIEPAASPTPAQEQQLAAVQANEGTAFDTAWISQQIGSHLTTLSLTREELEEGSDPTVLELARTSTPAVEQHLAELRAVAQKYGVPTSVPGGTGGQAAEDRSTLGWVLAALGGLAVLAGAVGLVRRRATAA